MKNIIKKFRRKWEQIKIIEDKEARRLSLKQKLDQLASVMGMGFGLRLGSREDRERLIVRSRWVALKKAAK